MSDRARFPSGTHIRLQVDLPDGRTWVSTVTGTGLVNPSVECDLLPAIVFELNTARADLGLTK